MSADQKFRRLYSPIWCPPGDPYWALAKRRNITNILQYDGEVQQFPNIGLFNLIYLATYGRPEKDAEDVQIRDKMIHSTQLVKLGNITVNELAALNTLPSFYNKILPHDFTGKDDLLSGYARKMNRHAT